MSPAKGEDGGSEVGDDLVSPSIHRMRASTLTSYLQFGDEEEDEGAKLDPSQGDAESTATPVTHAASDRGSRTGDASPNPMEYPEEEVSDEEQYENIRTIAVQKDPETAVDGREKSGSSGYRHMSTWRLHRMIQSTIAQLCRTILSMVRPTLSKPSSGCWESSRLSDGDG